MASKETGLLERFISTEAFAAIAAIKSATANIKPGPRFSGEEWIAGLLNRLAFWETTIAPLGCKRRWRLPLL